MLNHPAKRQCENANAFDLTQTQPLQASDCDADQDCHDRYLAPCSRYRTPAAASVHTRPHWGRGYAFEALQALLGHAFSALGMNRIEADIDPRNGASARLLERLGFRQEGYMPERWFVHGEYADTAFYGLLRRYWDERLPAHSSAAAAAWPTKTPLHRTSLATPRQAS